MISSSLIRLTVAFDINDGISFVEVAVCDSREGLTESTFDLDEDATSGAWLHSPVHLYVDYREAVGESQ